MADLIAFATLLTLERCSRVALMCAEIILNSLAFVSVGSATLVMHQSPY